MISLSNGRLTAQRYDKFVRLIVAGSNTPIADESLLEMHLDLSLEMAGQLRALLEMIGVLSEGTPQLLPERPLNGPKLTVVGETV